MITKWHQIIDARDLDALAECLANDVTLQSPIVHNAIRGKPLVLKYLRAAFHIFLNDKFHYVRECRSPGNAILEFETEIDGIYINGVDMIRWDKNEDIVDVKVMLRPLKAVNLIHQKMAEILSGESRPK